MGMFEFILNMSGLAAGVLGYLLAYKALKKQVEELKKNKENEE